MDTDNEETVNVGDVINEYRDALADVQQQLIMTKAANASLRRQLIERDEMLEIMSGNGSSPQVERPPVEIVDDTSN